VSGAARNGADDARDAVATGVDAPPAPIAGVLETCLYAPDLDAAERFYAGVLGLAVHGRVPGRHLFLRCGAGMLLVFDPAVTATAPGQVGGVPVPAHGAHGAGHVALAVPDAALDGWATRLAAHGVPLEATIQWPRGGRSLYLRDPAGNSVELASPRIWGLAEPEADA
jgi:catechol 2,3-dioxygenase-like lactoylglutathione lyase family enzyme